MITIIDAIAGKGKTSWAIKEMNTNNKDIRYLYLTPFLNEVERIKRDVKTVEFKEPSDKSKTKMSSLKKMLLNGNNIATTHALLKYIDDDMIKLLKSDKYVLILDEVLEVVEHIPITKDDIDMLISFEYIKILPDDSVTVGDKKYDGKHNYLIDIIKKGRVVCNNNNFFVWRFPAEVFEAFTQVYILTYMFEGSLMCPYLKSNFIDYEIKSVNDSYDIIEYEKPDLSIYKNLINIIDDSHSINKIGDNHNDLSFSWYSKKTKQSPLIKKLSKNISNYKRNIINCKSADFLWTTFKDKRYSLEDKGFKNDHTFCPHNARSINKYANKTTLAYTVNRFVNPYLIKYFKDNDIEFDQDMYSVSEMIQWVFRSAIRNNKPITLYCPSSRMRGLFIKWLSGDI